MFVHMVAGCGILPIFKTMLIKIIKGINFFVPLIAAIDLNLPMNINT